MGRIDSLLLNTAASATAHSFPLSFPSPHFPFTYFPPLPPLPIPFSPSPLTPSVHILTGSRAVQAGRRPNKIPQLISRYRDGPSPPPHPSTLSILSTLPSSLFILIYENIFPYIMIHSYSCILVLLPAAICSMIVSRGFQRGTRQHRLIMQGQCPKPS